MKKIYFPVMIILTLIIIAGCKREMYTINFITDTDVKIEDISVYSGDTLKRVESPYLADHNFSGWYSDDLYSTEFIFDETVVKSDLTLYAKYVTPTDYKSALTSLPDVIKNELKGSFDYFYETSNQDENSSGYGLARDRYPNNPNTSSIAATGYSLVSIPIGVENGYITHEDGYYRALKTLKTVNNLKNVSGFYYHFMNISTGVSGTGSEVSVIDTALFICGALVAGKYYGGEVEYLSRKLYEQIDWNFYMNPDTMMYYMSYNAEKNQFLGAWDRNNEQLMMYFLGAGSPKYPTGKVPYDVLISIIQLKDLKIGYESTKTGEIIEPFYINYGGQLFTHQYAHAYIDFRNINDSNGINWYDNAIKATKAQILYANDKSDTYKTLSLNSWGLSACDGPNGYKAYGAPPAENINSIIAGGTDGTVCPYAAIASINYTPEDSVRAAENYATYPSLQGKYGFKSGYNLGRADGRDNLVPWYASDYVGIDKGVTVMMIENYRSNLIWNIFMDIDYISSGAEIMGFKER